MNRQKNIMDRTAKREAFLYKPVCSALVPVRHIRLFAMSYYFQHHEIWCYGGTARMEVFKFLREVSKLYCTTI
jgi:hypothetical protein